MLDKIVQRAKQLLDDIVNAPGGPVLPDVCSLLEYFEEIKLEKRAALFPLESRVEVREKALDLKNVKKLDLVQMAAERLAFRYLYI